MILVLHLLVDMTVLKVNSKNTEPSQLTFRQAYGQAELRFFLSGSPICFELYTPAGILNYPDLQ